MWLSWDFHQHRVTRNPFQSRLTQGDCFGCGTRGNQLKLSYLHTMAIMQITSSLNIIIRSWWLDQDEELNQDQEMVSAAIICPQLSASWPSQTWSNDRCKNRGRHVWCWWGIKYKIYGIPYLQQIVYCSCFCPKWVWAMIGVKAAVELARSSHNLRFEMFPSPRCPRIPNWGVDNTPPDGQLFLIMEI